MAGFNGLSLVDGSVASSEFLFLGELPYEPLPEESDVGLSGLWRAYTPKGGRNGFELNDRLDRLAAHVVDVVGEHDRAALSGGDALFGFVGAKERELVTDITIEAAKFLEKGLFRRQQFRGGQSLLASGSRRLIIELASAVSECVPVMFGVYNSSGVVSVSKNKKRQAAIIIANWGPKFVLKWWDDTIIRRELEILYDVPAMKELLETDSDEGLESELELAELEIEQWLQTFTPSKRLQFAATNVRDPLAALVRAKSNLGWLTDANIAEKLGVTEAVAKETFPPFTHLELAVQYSDVSAGLVKVKGRLDWLTDANIAENLGVTEAVAKETFPPSTRLRLAVKYSDASDGLATESVRSQTTKPSVETSLVPAPAGPTNPTQRTR